MESYADWCHKLLISFGVVGLSMEPSPGPPAVTAFDGQHLFQLAGDRIQKIDRRPAACSPPSRRPAGGGDAGLAWAEGTLWVGQYWDRKIYQIDPQTGAIRTNEPNRFVTQGHLDRWRVLARHLGRWREQFEAGRSSNGKGP